MKPINNQIKTGKDPETARNPIKRSNEPEPIDRGRYLLELIEGDVVPVLGPDSMRGRGSGGGGRGRSIAELGVSLQQAGHLLVSPQRPLVDPSLLELLSIHGGGILVG